MRVSTTPPTDLTDDDLTTRWRKAFAWSRDHYQAPWVQAMANNLNVLNVEFREWKTMWLRCCQLDAEILRRGIVDAALQKYMLTDG